MIDREQIGIRIAGLRKKAGMSQATLAEKLGVSAQAVSKWENGNNLPDLEVFLELAWLFHTTMDGIVEGGSGDVLTSYPGEMGHFRGNSKSGLPGKVQALVMGEERGKLLKSLVPFCSDDELYNIAKELNNGKLELSIAAHIAQYDDKMLLKADETVYFAPEALGEATLRNAAPYFAKALSNHLSNVDPGLRRAAELMICPKCRGKLSLTVTEDNAEYFLCENGHRYDIVDGVVDFGSREIPGEMWSLHFKNYDYYLREQRSTGNPRYQMGEIPCNEMRWQEIKKRKPRVILDIACGCCVGLKYDLKRINWPCLIIMTDLSHRVLKYNKRYFSEEMVNPHVDIVCMACDCAHLPIADDCIDMVVSNGGFESMQDKMMDGFQEGHRILKNGGDAVYNISVVDDHNSENTQKWLKLCRTLDISFYSLFDSLYDITEWKAVCQEVGYRETESTQIYGEMPAPAGDKFPFRNEILQWMGECLCVSKK